MLILYDYAGGYVRGEHTNSVLAYRLRENKWVKKCGMSLARSGWDHLYIYYVSTFIMFLISVYNVHLVGLLAIMNNITRVNFLTS